MPSDFLQRGKGVSDLRRAGKSCFVPGKRNSNAFTLVEVLVGCAVLLLLLVMLFSMTNQTTSVVTTASTRVDAFQTARLAFDTISQRISQATMNTYWDYYNSGNQRRDPTQTSGSQSPNGFVPYIYGRASDLHFLVQSNPHFGQAVYFAAPEGVSTDITKDQTAGLLNAIGYYVQYGGDAAYLPSVTSQQRYRYRLMQAVQPAENFQIYMSSTNAWVTGVNGSTGVNGTAWPLADNVIALIVWPRESVVQDPTGTAISGSYQYDSRSLPASNGPGVFPIQYAQEPPSVQIAMVVIDEASARRLDTASATEPAAISNALNLTGTTGKSLFTDVTQFTNDMQILSGTLAAAHINCRVFSSMLNLRESKWTSQ